MPPQSQWIHSRAQLSWSLPKKYSSHAYSQHRSDIHLRFLQSWIWQLHENDWGQPAYSAYSILQENTSSENADLSLNRFQRFRLIVPKIQLLILVFLYLWVHRISISPDFFLLLHITCTGLSIKFTSLVQNKYKQCHNFQKLT